MAQPHLPNIRFPTCDGTEVRAWVRRVARLFDGYGVDDPIQRAHFMAAHLMGPAQLWLDSVEQTGGRFQDDVSLGADLIRFFETSDGLSVREDIQNTTVQRCGSLMAYITAQTTNFARLPDMSEADRIYCFVKGLPARCCQEVMIADPLTLQEAIMIAQRVDGIMGRRGPPIGRRREDPPPAGRRREDPMELDRFEGRRRNDRGRGRQISCYACGGNHLVKDCQELAIFKQNRQREAYRLMKLEIEPSISNEKAEQQESGDDDNPRDDWSDDWSEDEQMTCEDEDMPRDEPLESEDIQRDEPLESDEEDIQRDEPLESDEDDIQRDEPLESVDIQRNEPLESDEEDIPRDESLESVDIQRNEPLESVEEDISSDDWKDEPRESDEIHRNLEEVKVKLSAVWGREVATSIESTLGAYDGPRMGKSPQHALIRLVGSFRGYEKPIEFLVDSGATHNFLPLSIARNAGLVFRKTDYVDSIQLGDGRTAPCLGVASETEVRLGSQHQSLNDFVVFPSKSHTVVLGMPWLYSVDPLINWRAGDVYFKDGTKLKGRSRLAKPTYVMSALQAKKAIRKKDNQVWLGFLKVMNDDEQETNEDLSRSIDATAMELSATGESLMRALLKEYKDVFPETLPGLPPEREVQHRIQLTDDEPVFRRPFRLSPKEMTALHEQLQEMLALGLIRPSSSPYGAPVLFVKKADGSLRMVVDYRALNKKTIRDRFPLPRIDELVDRLGKARLFTKIDLRSGYYQIRNFEEDIPKTAFVSPLGSYELLVMPMGQSNSVSTFARAMQTMFPFAEFHKFLLNYLDDFLIFSETEDDHVKHVRRVLEILRRNKLYCKFSKCEFGRKEVAFVGQVVSNGVRKIDPAKAKAIREYPKPTCAAEVRSFYGLVNFCRDFLPGLSHFSAPITDLTSETRTFEWTMEHDRVFNRVKELVARAIELTIPDPDKKFFLQTDASDRAVGAVLMQFGSSGHLVPVAVANRKLNVHEKNYPTHEKEMLAIVWALKTFRHYVEGCHVEIQTDHAALRFFDTQPNLSRRMARWAEEMAQYEYEIKYIPGETNIFADLLSRPPCTIEKEPASLAALDATAPVPIDDYVKFTEWPIYMVDILQGMRPVGLTSELIAFLEEQRDEFEYDEERQFLYRRSGGERRLFIPLVNRADLIKKWHIGQGHTNAREVMEKLKSRVWWPGMSGDVLDWVSGCRECQLHSPNVLKPHEEAHVMKVVEKPFSRWSLDFIGVLPETQNGNRWIITAVDHCTRWPIARALKEATAKEVARFIYEEIVVRFGCPDEILTDRGKNFLANVLQEYLRELEVRHLKTSAFHPRTNGKVESLNGVLGRMLAKAVGVLRHKWDDFLEQAIFNCRVRKHRITGFSPYFLVYGVEPKLPGDSTKPHVIQESGPLDITETRARLLEKLGQDRQAAWERSFGSASKAKLAYDKLVKSDPLKQGEWVLMRRGVKYKFMSNWVGPFQIHAVKEAGTYQLREPSGMIKPDLVHRDRLKRCKVDDSNLPKEFWSEEILETLDENFFDQVLGNDQEGNERSE